MQQRRLLVVFLALAFCLGLTWTEPWVHFSPPLAGDQRVESYIIGEIDGARRQVLVQEYPLTEPGLMAALIRARTRGVQVTALVGSTGGPAVTTLKAAGILVYFDPVHLVHQKVLIIDERLVIGGGFTLTRHASNHNIETHIFLTEKPVVQRYLRNFKRRLAVARRQ
jgi:phosphatidylserine/phosphatidylglycerophosphate/cardiolipin synthase-like enzyme